MKTAAQKTKESMINKYGSKEAYSEHMRNIGKNGGQAKVKKGFSSNIELARKVGAIGGSISKRGKAIKK